MDAKNVVILGGGFGGLRAFYHLKNHLSDKVEVTLIDPRSTTLARPALPEVAFAEKPIEHARFALKPIIEGRGGKFIKAKAERINTANNKVILDNGKPISYDYLFLTVGAVKNYDAIPGYRDFGFSICDDTEAPKVKKRMKEFSSGPIVIGSAKSEWGSRIEAPRLDAPCEGPIGEIMFMVDHELRRRDIRDQATISVFSPAEIFFEDVGERVHNDVVPLIQKSAIEVQTHKVLKRIAEDHVEFEDGSTLESAFTIIIPPYTGNPLVINSNLGDEKGFIPTDKTMRHLDFANIFAAGDATALAMPKLGHLATMQADIAAKSLIKEITGQGKIPDFQAEIFCIMNRGGLNATLIFSDTYFGGDTDLTFNGPMAHFMKWSFDTYYFYTRGHLPPEMLELSLKAALQTLKGARTD
jgi:sulfide:quinone oxidoreductase